MRTITGTGENYAVLIDDLNIVQEVIPIPVDSLVTSNHDDLNAKKMQDLNESQVTAELAKSEYTLNILPLPEYGELCTEKVFYQYGDKIVITRQTHNRTEHAIEDIPALFTFFRVDTGELEWTMNELVQVGWKRFYNDVQYECIQAHMTVIGQTPNLTPALWKVVLGDISVWVQPTGGHDAYNIGDKVHFPTINDPVYESLINANVWSPSVYPAGWKLL